MTKLTNEQEHAEHGGLAELDYQLAKLEEMTKAGLQNPFAQFFVDREFLIKKEDKK